jgi:VIT1/CCC1 family predicted Fe2+/Mn2+ transporter
MLRNWRDERDSAALYEALATLEHNPRISRVFSKLAQSEYAHCAYWETRLRTLGQIVPNFRPSWRTRVMMRLAQQFGVTLVVPSIATRELADHNRYSHQADASAAGLTKEEQGHAAVLRRVAAYGAVMDQRGVLKGAAASSLGNDLRAAILGANDGVASNFCLLMGVAGGGVPMTMIVLTGVAGLLAGACSMALGEWLSVTNAREMADSLIDTDVKGLHSTAAWKRDQLALIYEAQGMTEVEAMVAARKAGGHEPEAVTNLIAEERAMAFAGAGNNPASAAAFSFSLFALGASVPLLPFLVASPAVAVIASIVSSLTVLFVIGVLTSFFNRRSALFSGLRQIGIGAAAAALTYAAGRLVAIGIS